MTHLKTHISSVNSNSRTGGFTLIEMLVVILIILVILGLSIAEMENLFTNADVRTTRTILSEMSNIATDYQTRTGAAAAQSDSAYSSNNSSASIIYFVQQLKTNAPESYKLMKSVNPDFIKVDSNQLPKGVIDAWGNWIRYTVTGSPANGLPSRSNQNGGSRPYFASAGPDGTWGLYNNNNKPDAAAKDNIYSFNLKGHQHEGS